MAHPTALPARDAIVATARQSIARGSKSFAAASLLFAPAVRERAWLLYAWCRACDDIADGQDHGHGETIVGDAPARLAAMETLTEAALAGTVVGEPAFDALRLVAAETAMPPAFARDLIAGFALDAADWRPVSEDDLYRYCYHVAGVVGCMMAVVMGVPPDDEATLDRACDLGLAFQLANIARDIAADARIGRCYLPVDWLVEMDLPPGEFIKPPYRERLVVLARRLADRAQAFEASARFGTPRLGFRSAWAVLSAADIYGAIARDVARDPAAALTRRVTISSSRKLAMMGRAFGESLTRERRYRTPAPRPAWTRPVSPCPSS